MEESGVQCDVPWNYLQKTINDNNEGDHDEEDEEKNLMILIMAMTWVKYPGMAPNTRLTKQK